MYVFLDIDGVLNKKEQWSRLYYLDRECIKQFCTFINEIRKYYVYIILTSSWRNGFISTKNKNNTPQIKQLEQMLGEYGVSIRGKVPIIKNGKRDDEIKEFMNLHSVENFIIIDDDKNEYSRINRYNYFTDSSTGFTKKDIKGCLKCI
ncbi:MAG: HAD domain-containing protein [Clostridium sp.]|nr:HAD domain-containing protein [Clostridium sp.]